MDIEIFVLLYANFLTGGNSNKEIAIKDNPAKGDSIK